MASVSHPTSKPESTIASMAVIEKKEALKPPVAGKHEVSSPKVIPKMAAFHKKPTQVRSSGYGQASSQSTKIHEIRTSPSIKKPVVCKKQFSLTLFESKLAKYLGKGASDLLNSQYQPTETSEQQVISCLKLDDLKNRNLFDELVVVIKDNIKSKVEIKQLKPNKLGRQRYVFELLEIWKKELKQERHCFQFAHLNFVLLVLHCKDDKKGARKTALTTPEEMLLKRVIRKSISLADAQYHSELTLVSFRGH